MQQLVLFLLKVRANIVGTKTGIPLLITIKTEDTNNNYHPLVGALVDVWHGYFTSEHFLRGRQTIDSNGLISFISIYPG
jgi:protocatechuate 3,4-dioxygenase beta subunit